MPRGCSAPSSGAQSRFYFPVPRSPFRVSRAIPLTDPPNSCVRGSVRKAIEELDAWDEPAFRIVRATLERRFPEQAEFAMKGLKPATGAAAVLAVERLPDRLDALESSPERKASRKEDEAALAILRQRGIDDAKRKRMRELVATAKSVVPLAQIDPQAVEQEDAARREALNNLYAWSGRARGASSKTVELDGASYLIESVVSAFLQGPRGPGFVFNVTIRSTRGKRAIRERVLSTAWFEGVRARLGQDYASDDISPERLSLVRVLRGTTDPSR